MPERLLITGASGTIGGAVGRALVEDGFEVLALSRDPERIADRFHEVARMPAPGAGADAWAPLLEDVSDVIHCAGIADAAAEGEEALFTVNAGLAQELAAVAASRISGKFVLLSSVRAVAGAAHGSIIDGNSRPAPQDGYGRSKLAAETAVRAAFRNRGRFTILRPAPVYGGKPRGNLGTLLRLAALPLPLGGLTARRSLLDLEACVAAVRHVLSRPETDGRAYLVSDRHALTIAEIVGALRSGLDRSPHLPALPEPLLHALFVLLGRRQSWERLAGNLVVDPGDLAATGWQPAPDTAARLSRFAAEAAGRAGERPAS